MSEEMFLKIQDLTRRSKTNLWKRLAKLIEEVGEFSEALLSSEEEIGCEYKHLTKDDRDVELVDVLILVLSMLSLEGRDVNYINQIIDTKTSKWEANLRK